MNLSPRTRIVYLASHNKHKADEIQELVGKSWDVRSISSLNSSITWEETGNSFIENARIKAQAVRLHTSAPIIADDSGLQVDYLKGAPGIYSSRFAGEEGNDALNNSKLLKMLKGVPQNQRGASFLCCLVFLYENNQEKSYEGLLNGQIAMAPTGKEGFGYDPIFIPDGYQESLAVLGPKTKNKLSHRKKAVEFWLQDNQ